MDKKNVISLVLGLIIGALAIWLLVSFTDLGSTFILKYQGGSKTANTANTLSATNTTNTTGGSEKAKTGFDEWISKINSGECQPEFPGYYDVAGTLTKMELIEEMPPKFRLTWNLDMGIPISCVQKGWTLDVQWWDLRGHTDDFPDDPFPRAWFKGADNFKNDTITFTENVPFKVFRLSYQGYQNEAPGYKYGIWNEFVLKNPSGNVVSTWHYAAKATSHYDLFWTWDTSREATFY